MKVKSIMSWSQKLQTVHLNKVIHEEWLASQNRLQRGRQYGLPQFHSFISHGLCRYKPFFPICVSLFICFRLVRLATSAVLETH